MKGLFCVDGRVGTGVMGTERGEMKGKKERMRLFFYGS